MLGDGGRSQRLERPQHQLNLLVVYFFLFFFDLPEAFPPLEAAFSGSSPVSSKNSLSQPMEDRICLSSPKETASNPFSDTSLQLTVKILQSNLFWGMAFSREVLKSSIFAEEPTQRATPGRPRHATPRSLYLPPLRTRLSGLWSNK